MRPCVTLPLVVRGAEFGGPKPLFCVPLVAKDLNGLLSQAEVAHRFKADVVEWRVDSYGDLSHEGLIEAAHRLRSTVDHEPIVFTLRIAAEGGARELSQDVRRECINAVVQSRVIDLIDVELSNPPEMLKAIIDTARNHATRVILSFHDFQGTPSTETLLSKISEMITQGADVAKIACMPQDPGDVLRLLQATLSARHAHPAVPLCTMSMGRLGSLSRVAGFLYGSDMAFAVGQEVSAPGQIPIRDARSMAEALLRYA